FRCSRPLSVLHLSPTRRSSDLGAGDVPAVEPDRTRGRAHDAGDCLQRGGLTRPVGSEHQHALTTTYSEVDTVQDPEVAVPGLQSDRKSTRLNSSHVSISYAVFC